MLSPRYEYSKAALLERAKSLCSLAAPFGLTVRYAMKANPHPEIIHILHEQGVHFDASSSYEASELLEQGIPGLHISLSSQQSPHNLSELLTAGVQFVATSFRQLDEYLACSNRPDTVAVRINPPIGHGHNNRTNTGGVNSSFGIWHEYIPQLIKRADEAGVSISKIHIHIGSGADPKVWGEVMDVSLNIIARFPDATTLDIGGGYKVHRYGEEAEADMSEIIKLFSEKLEAFKQRTNRALQLEIEPGTYMVAKAGVLVAHVDDIVDTGKSGYQFLRLNTGMNDFLRTSLYGAQHRIEVVNQSTETARYVVVGHNCESGDILTPAPGNPEEITAREFKKAAIGDEVRIYDVGAYAASMSAKGYNSFPNALEVIVD